MRTEFAFQPPATLPAFQEDYGKVENVTVGPDVQMLKWFLSQKMPNGAEATHVVLGTRRSWTTRSSYVEFRAIVRIDYDQIPKPEPLVTPGLYLVVLTGRLKETLIAVFPLAEATLDPHDFGPAVVKEKAEALPSAENIRLCEMYPDRPEPLAN
jgi:hypothetical protein